MSDHIENKLLILDRRHPDFERIMWTLRQVASRAVNKGFARWLVSPERGRFIVLEPDFGATIEGVFAFFDDEAELMSYVRRYFEPLPPEDRHLGLIVAHDLLAKFEQDATASQRALGAC